MLNIFILFYLHGSLAGTDTKGYHLEQHLQEICFNEKMMKYLKIYHMYLALQMRSRSKVMKGMIRTMMTHYQKCYKFEDK